MKYTGGCHCGRVRYEVELTLDRVVSCNCSICAKKGHLLSFAPSSQFRLISGESELSDYQFNTKNVHHLFCKHCGVQSFTRGKGKDGQEMCSINVRCLDGVDVETLEVMNVDGRSR